MREILFRGKHPNGEWVEGSLIAVKDFTAILEYESDRYDYPYLNNDLGTIDGYAVPVIPDTVGQYTGLTDKNGKKIFEGDVVRLEDGETGAVIFRDAGFAFDNSGCSFCVSSQCERLVIGNIHDNPELVGGAKKDD